VTVYRDYKRPDDDTVSGLSKEVKEKAKARVAQATRLLEQQEGGSDVPQMEQVAKEDYEWIDMDIRDVPVADLPDLEGISGADDFQKLSEPEMQAGLKRLQEMKSAIDSGVGAHSDYWADHDRERNLDYAHGYQGIYDAFYGHDAIRVNKDGDSYDIVNGRHRIWLARRMDVQTLPMRVIERRRTS